MGGRPFVTTRALQQLHSTNSALFVSLPFAFVAWFLDGLIEQCLVTGTGWDGCIAWFLRQPGFRSFLCLMLLPVGGFPSGWVAYSQGVCYLVVHGAALGLRASLFSLSLRIKRGMVSVTVLFGHLMVWYVCVCVCDCFDRLYLTTMKSRISLMRTFFLLYCCGFSPFLHLRTVGPRFLCFCSDCMGI